MQSRFNFIEDKENRLLIVRPVGDIPGDLFAQHVIEAYRGVEMPWTYNRIIDMRRHTGHVEDKDRGAIAKVWAELTAGISYRAYVAMLMRHTYEKVRLPQISTDFPNETICVFNDYHEAVGWVLAPDRMQFLAGHGDAPPTGQDGAEIEIQ